MVNKKRQNIKLKPSELSWIYAAVMDIADVTESYISYVYIIYLKVTICEYLFKMLDKVEDESSSVLVQLCSTYFKQHRKNSIYGTLKYNSILLL